MDNNCRQLLANDRQLQEQQHTFHGQLQQKDMQLEAKDRQLQQNQHALASRDEALERKERELQQTQQFVSEFQESLQQKDKTITELQRTISEHERKTQQLEQGATASRDTPPQQEPVDTRQTTVAAAQKAISKMRWREGKNAPVVMIRGAAVVHGNTAYFRPGGSRKVYSYLNIHGKEQWSRLPDNPNRWFGLVVIDGLLTLFDLRDHGTGSYLRKFREECHLLSLARHPNVVQYLGTYTDPDTRLPVLLMELCDESLTAFLERSPGPLSYHIQVNICHDVTLALVYLYTLQWSHPQRPNGK